jgi:hypothetical protein
MCVDERVGKFVLRRKSSDLKGLQKLKTILISEPANLDTAHAYWGALGILGGHDVRSGGFVIEAYRDCALASAEGAVALAWAYRQLYTSSGERPRVELFDQTLTQALRSRLSELSNLDRAVVKWVLESIEKSRKVRAAKDHPESLSQVSSHLINRLIFQS